MQLVEAGGAGTALTLLAEPEESRDPGLSAAAREAVIAAITTEPPDGSDGAPEWAGRQPPVHLLATLHQVAALTAGGARAARRSGSTASPVASPGGGRGPAARAAGGPPASPPAGSA